MQERRNNSRTNKPKVCRFCEAGGVNYIDFKDGEALSRYQTEGGKIMPRRVTGTCLKHQKMLGIAIKRARIISLVL